MAQSGHASKSKRLRAELRKARADAGLTQVELSKLLKKPQSYVSKYESGERRLDVLEILDILRFLKVNPADFLSALD